MLKSLLYFDLYISKVRIMFCTSEYLQYDNLTDFIVHNPDKLSVYEYLKKMHAK